MLSLELAVQDVPGAVLAHRYGAARIELCSALTLGGLTPSAGLVHAVRTAAPTLSVHVLIRPRPGDYVYDAATVDLMRHEIAACRAAGVAGVVIGALTPDGGLDEAAIRALIDAADGLHVTFHRAMDRIADADADAVVLRLADLGVGRILSSGGALQARDGLPRLRRQQALAGERLALMPGGGVRSSDFAAFAAAGLWEVHLSAKAAHAPAPTPARTAVAAAAADGYDVTDAALVADAAATLAALS